MIHQISSYHQHPQYHVVWVCNAYLYEYNHERPQRGYRNQELRPIAKFELGKVRREELLKEAA
jgi:hypothetical protein